jgi:serine/threonine-protein kinase
MTVVPKSRIVVGAAALAGLAALGGVGAVLNNDTHSATGATRFDVTEVVTTTSPPDNSALTKLMKMLPAGFDASNCAVVDNPPRDSLATVDCEQNSLPNGPTSGRFSLYPDEATLETHFQTAASEDQILPCPGGPASASNWQYAESPNEPAGKVVCGTYEGTPDLVWSQNDKLLLGNLQGTDVQSIYDFWSNNTI